MRDISLSVAWPSRLRSGSEKSRRALVVTCTSRCENARQCVSLNGAELGVLAPGGARHDKLADYLFV
jgi:hypothetical protein